MGYHPRIESTDTASFITTRSRNAELWFINNKGLDQEILKRVAVCTDRYKAKIYALAISGNHNHLAGAYPGMNRSSFMRDLNSVIAKAIPKFVPTYPGGSFWGRRYSSEIVPDVPEDIEERFFYTVLQPIQDGLVDNISKYRGYNCFDDAVSGRVLKFKVINFQRYNQAKKRNPKVSIEEYTTIISFQYERLPGYEHLSQGQYKTLMYRKLKERTNKIIAQYKEAGIEFVGPNYYKMFKPGDKPKNSKTSDINSTRPRVLSVCPKRHKQYLDHYFEIYFAYKQASKEYRAGNLFVVFPKGTYKPYLPMGL